ncbi:MAG: GAF domain-containing protein [Candidatus Cloacimonadota bacterium]|nr:MAG: GAF domain-containing protein [Candidatus Cloacimonadota bacterium]
MENKKRIFSELLHEIKKIIEGGSERDLKLQSVCVLLKDKVPYYDWTGFYIVENINKNELVLGPFVGEPTEHKKITFGQGICGQAAQLKKTFVVQDVTRETNYLSCNLKVLSEIVVPILKDAVIVGELDIDSHTLAPFSDEDRKFLENTCSILSNIF